MTEPKEKKDKPPALKKVDFAKQVFIAMYQTTSGRITMENFTSSNQAELWAAEKAHAGKTVAIFGPQVCVLEKPEPAKAKQVSLDWQTDPA